MGFFDRLTAQFIEIIEWVDDDRNTMVYRFERYGNEIKYGAKLVVREGQAAVFVNEGKLADVYVPGTHTLETKNMPILSTIMGWKYGFESPFKAEVYFVNTRQFTDLKWGTANPIMMRDADFGAVRLRAFGAYAIKITDPGLFIKDIVGTDGAVTPGPLPETKAVVGGFSILEVPTREDALAWAARIAASCRCAQEVREIMFDPES